MDNCFSKKNYTEMLDPFSAEKINAPHLSVFLSVLFPGSI